MNSLKNFAKEYGQILAVVFFSGAFYMGTKDALFTMQSSVNEIIVRQKEMQKEDNTNRKETDARINSLELRQTITELILKELTDKKK